MGFILVVAEFTVGRIVPIRDVGPSFTQYDENYGKRLKSNLQTVRHTPEFTMTFSTNALGFRGEAMDALPERPVLFLGDSFTMGYGVNDGEEYPALMADYFDMVSPNKKIPVLNTGLGNSGNGRWVKFINEYADEIQPQLVVMQVMANDFEDNSNENLFGLNENGGVFEFPVQPPSTQRKIQNVIEAVPGLASTNLVGLLRQVRFGSGGAGQAADAGVTDADPELELTLAILREALELSKANDWPVVAMIVELTDNRRDAVISLFEEYDILVIESPAKKDEPEFYYEIDGHWNAAGHAEAARLLIDAVESNDLLSVE